MSVEVCVSLENLFSLLEILLHYFAENGLLLKLLYVTIFDTHDMMTNVMREEVLKY